MNPISMARRCSRWLVSGCTRVLGPRWGVAVVLLLSIAVCVIVAWVFAAFQAPSTTLVMSAGPQGSSYYRSAQRYQKWLAQEGIHLKILESAGAIENLRRLEDPKSGVDIAFVQGGLGTPEDYPRLNSLGTVSVQPLYLFYRNQGHQKPLETLAQLAGRRIVIGPSGAGVHFLALDLLKANGITPGSQTTLLDMDDAPAVAALKNGAVDALFLMGESVPLEVIRELRSLPDVHLFHFVQAEGYARRFKYLNVLNLPRGAQDLGRDLPPQDLSLIGPAVELLARDDLHPALSDVLLETARKVHGGAGLFRKRGEFPSGVQQSFPVSEDAQRYYTSGKTWVYRSMPFWLARLVTGALTVLVPLLILLIPALRIVPAVYRWGHQSRLYRWYAPLLDIERQRRALLRSSAAGQAVPPMDFAVLLRRLDDIEHRVSALRVPAPFADVYYGLRGHIDYVRSMLIADDRARAQAKASCAAP